MNDFLEIHELAKLSDDEKAHRIEMHLEQAKDLKFDQFIVELLALPLWASMKSSSAKYKEIIIALSNHLSDYKGIEPSYHNQNHFKDVCLSISLLLGTQRVIFSLSSEQSPWKISDHESWILLLSAVCHDLGHDGTINKNPFQLEKRSVELLQEFVEKMPLTLFERKEMVNSIEPIILATDPKYFSTLIDKFNKESRPNRSDYLSMLMVEADLLASALPNKGKILGERLAEEWQLTNPKAAASVKTNKGRLNFLQYIRFLSPQSKALGIEGIRKTSINKAME